MNSRLPDRCGWTRKKDRSSPAARAICSAAERTARLSARWQVDQVSFGFVQQPGAGALEDNRIAHGLGRGNGGLLVFGFLFGHRRDAV